MSVEAPTRPISVMEEPLARLDVLEAEVRSELRELQTNLRASVAHAISVGQLLSEAKIVLEAERGYGNWSAWLRDNFRLTDRTARTYMSLADNREKVGDAPTIRAAVVALRGLGSEAASEPAKTSAATSMAQFRKLAHEKAEQDAWDAAVSRHGIAKAQSLIADIEKKRKEQNAMLRGLRAAVERASALSR